MPYTVRVDTNAALERLERLIQKRMAPGADKDAVDAHIWDLFGETWAVMFTDLSGFSRRVAEFGIIHFLQIIYESQRVFVPCLDEYGGILLKVEADSMLVIFRKVRRAVECAIAMQHAAKAYNEGRPEEEQLLLCLGLGYGAMLRVGDHDVFGAEVNAASKLGEDTARAWEILVTQNVKDIVDREEIPGVDFEPLEYVPPGADAAYRMLYPL
ncbi:MAG: adenylate/guanylate cyclase domain-containing protein [Anaerolineae bacterium]|nr:MAG: adenylate/guanylate cyclase domain-containing protein [Anaerolineae bacterium]